MSDLRDLMDEAAGPPPDPLDFEVVERRARRQQMMQVGATVAVLVAVVAVAVSALVTLRTEPPPVIERPDSTPIEEPTPAEVETQDVPMNLPDGLTVEGTRVLPIPHPEGRHRYIAIAVVRNELEGTAVQVGGELSLHTATGREIGTAEPAPATILPGQLGLLIKEPVDLPESLGDDPRLGLDLAILTRVDDPSVPEVTVGDVDYQNNSPQPCVTGGTVHNASDLQIDGLRVAMLAYVDGELYTADVADLRPLPGGGSMSFGIQTPAPGCPSPDSLSDLQILVEYPVELIQPAS